MIMYRHYDRDKILELLQEIGRYNYERALENMRVKDRPLAIKGWYLEATEDYLKLCYRYPSNTVLMLMDVNRYDNIPRQGWERLRVER